MYNTDKPLTAVQGIGAGGIVSLTQIIVADLVPLHLRGSYNGLVAMYVLYPFLYFAKVEFSR